MSTTRLALLALLLPGALLSARAARADLLVEGYKGVQHELRVEGLGEHPELVFVLSPVAFGRGAAYVSSDRPLPYMKAAEGRLYALRRDGAPAADDLRQIDLDWLKAHAVAVSWHEFSQLGQIPEERPEARIVTVFRLARLDGRKLVIEGVREELFDGAGKLLERRVPAVHERAPDGEAAAPDRAPATPDRRGSWAPRGLGSGLYALPLLAAFGLLGATWRRRGGGPGALALAGALTLGAAAVARADVPPDPVFVVGSGSVVFGAVAAAGSLVALVVVFVVRRRRSDAARS